MRSLSHIVKQLFMKIVIETRCSTSFHGSGFILRRSVDAARRVANRASRDIAIRARQLRAARPREVFRARDAARRELARSDRRMRRAHRVGERSTSGVDVQRGIAGDLDERAAFDVITARAAGHRLERRQSESFLAARHHQRDRAAVERRQLARRRRSR